VSNEENGAPAPSVGENLNIDFNFIKAFIDTTRLTLKVQCFTEIVPQKPYIKGKGQVPAAIDIAGVIGLTSKHFSGSIALCFPEKTFLSLVGKMLGEEYKEINDEVEDAAGELLNIIFGQAKISLNKKGYEIEKALPSIFRGQDLKVKHLAPAPTVMLPFAVGDMTFHIEVGIDPNPSKPAA